MRALVVGGAGCVFKDVKRALAMFEPDFTVAANDIGIRREHIDHWCTMHPLKMRDWLRERTAKGFPVPALWTAVHKNKGIREPVFNQVESQGGSSGMLCVRVARHLGATKIVLAGVPMTATMGHFHVTGNWAECPVYLHVWEKEAVHLRKDTRSMSGWTQQLVGAPTAEWLKE